MSSGLAAQAEALVDVGRAHEALALAGRAVGQAPEDPSALCALANAYLRLDDGEACADAAQRAAALAPEAERPHRLAALGLLRADDLDAAEREARTAVTLAPEQAVGEYVLGMVLRARRRLSAARAAAEAAVRLDPGMASAHTLLGEILLEEGRLLAAHQATSAAVSLAPDNSDALTALAMVQLRRGRVGEAAPMLEQAARSDADSLSWQIGLLRYVRGAAGGMATWPVISPLVILAVLSLVQRRTETLVAGFVYLGLAGMLTALRMRRIRRLSPAVRRWVARRGRRRDALGRVEGPPGFRPWWWILLIRIPLAARALAVTALAGAFVAGRFAAGAEKGSGAWIITALVVAGAAALWVRVVVRWCRARRPHPLYPAP